MTNELARLKKLTSPEKIQDFLDELAFNFEKGGETCSPPLVSIARGSAHCLEGALIAVTALSLMGERPLLMNLKTSRGDDDHAVALFKRDGLWGALSKTNHAVLRYRDPVYKTLRELALSYFHEYYLSDTGRKTLTAYSRPFSLTRFGTKWMTTEHDVWDIAYALADTPHLPLAPRKALSKTRPASRFERRTIEKSEWKRNGTRS